MRRTLLLLLVACAGCTDAYRKAGCASTHELPPMPPAAERGIVCEVADDATTTPSCDDISSIYRARVRSGAPYGIIVTRASSDESSCQGAYAPSGKRISDLPHVD